MKKYFIAFLITCNAIPLFAWGKLGHMATAQIAENNLTVQTRKKVHDILGPGVGLADISTWADDIKFARPQTRGLHFIDIDIKDSLAPGTLGFYCKNGCVISGINDNLAILKDPNADLPAKREALKFIVHFLGDLHQPLHCAMDNGDKGGNGKTVHFEGLKMNMHSLFDHVIAKKDLSDTYAVLAQEASNYYDSADLNGTVEHWVIQSHNIAKDLIYPSYYKYNGVFDESWANSMRPVIVKQIERGGIRLAELLNNSLK